MTRMLSTLLLAAAALAPFAAVDAQKTPAAQVAIADIHRVYAECTACKAANAQLQSQAQSLQQRQQALQSSIQTEGQSIQAAVNALAGKQPDAALQKRIDAFRQKQQAAEQELQGRAQTVQRNQQYVLQQINQKLSPIFQSVATAHGANLMYDVNAALWNAPSLDVTNEVLSQLNAQLPSVSTTAPAAPAAQGR